MLSKDKSNFSVTYLKIPDPRFFVSFLKFFFLLPWSPSNRAVRCCTIPQETGTKFDSYFVIYHFILHMFSFSKFSNSENVVTAVITLAWTPKICLECLLSCNQSQARSSHHRNHGQRTVSYLSQNKLFSFCLKLCNWEFKTPLFPKISAEDRIQYIVRF